MVTRDPARKPQLYSRQPASRPDTTPLAAMQQRAPKARLRCVSQVDATPMPHNASSGSSVSRYLS